MPPPMTPAPTRYRTQRVDAGTALLWAYGSGTPGLLDTRLAAVITRADHGRWWTATDVRTGVEYRGERRREAIERYIDGGTRAER